MIAIIIYLSIVTASVSFIISEAVIFRRVRYLFLRLLPPLGKLVGCYFCVGYWVALALACLYHVRVLPPLCYSWLDWAMSATIIAWGSANLCTLLVIGMQRAGR